MKTLFLLIVVYGHGAYTVPGITSEMECERLYKVLDDGGWVRLGPGIKHDCIAYTAQ